MRTEGDRGLQSQRLGGYVEVGRTEEGGVHVERQEDGLTNSCTNKKDLGAVGGIKGVW